jgi:GT2 family glycosyltransferase
MAFRRSVLVLVGPFDIALDGGTPALSGGDSEMFARILAGGYSIIYEPAALIWHRHRPTRKELRKTMFGYGAGWYAWWTRKLFFEGELSVAPVAVYWFLAGQLPVMARSLLRRQNAPSLDLILLEILGCISGPWLYLRSRRIHPH